MRNFWIIDLTVLGLTAVLLTMGICIRWMLDEVLIVLPVFVLALLAIPVALLVA